MHSLAYDGFKVIPDVLPAAEVEALRASLSALGVAPGHRNLMQRAPAVAAVASSEKLLNLLKDASGSEAFPVRSIFFDKTPEANWLVPWHQDLSIATKEQIDLPGYGPWSKKDGVPHVQPPIEILESMVTIRLHLDDCNKSNGALRVIPGTHRQGRLSASQIQDIRSRQAEVFCSARAGDALLMRPLLLHSSSEAVTPSHRRVIHLEYACCQLPEGLGWAESSGGKSLHR
jgi:ectoine hydroxylase-related dioxygenase (phytanoyl-CoA dioxygenase family)